jgi:RIO kinase 1
MSSHYQEDEQMDPFEDLHYIPTIKNMPRAKHNGSSKPRPAARKPKEEVISLLAAEQDEQFKYTYQAGELEAGWLYDSLGYFHMMKWIDDILRVVKGGKEASVYLCAGNQTTGAEYIAAKVYRPRKFRQLKNDHLYREGRQDLDGQGNAIINKGLLHAIQKKTEFGRELLHTSWLEHEYQTMRLLHAAGADVPIPYASGNNAILMGYYGDAVMGAPTLNDVDLDAAEARQLFERVIHNIDLMLAHNRVHGDLSAYNILYWDGEIVLIDFPQAVHPDINHSSYKIFERDVVRVSEYFQSQGIRSNPRKLATDLWQRYNHQFTPQINPKVLDEDRDDERSLWESLRNA